VSGWVRRKGAIQERVFAADREGNASEPLDVTLTSLQGHHAVTTPCKVSSEERRIGDHTMNKRGAVIFLFDRKYIEPFKVFTHSLRHALDDSQEDLVVLTDDDEV
jgi:hypothetical protein